MKVSDLEFEFYGEDGSPQENELPGNCSMAVLSSFPTDENIESEFKGLIKEAHEYDDAPTKKETFPTWAQGKEAVVKQLVGTISDLRDDSSSKAYIITLSSQQKLAQTAALKAGFKKVGHYTGRDGVITVFQKGLRA